MKKVISLLIILCLILSACGSTQQKDRSDIGLADGVLDVGMECNYAPYNWTVSKDMKSSTAVPIEGNSSSYCDGYDVMIATDIANDLGVDLKVHAISWDGLITSLNSGNIDAVIAGMSPTKERLEEVNFTDSYYTEDIELQVVVNANSKYATAKSINDFDGASISVQQGTFYGELISQMPGASAATELGNYDSLIQSTESGVIDGYIAEVGVAEDQVATNKNLVAISPSEGFTLTPDQNTVAIGIAKDNDKLLTSMNDSLGKISEDTRQTYMQMAIDGEAFGSVKANSDALKDGVLTVGMECNYAPYNWSVSEEKASDNAVKISGGNSYCDGYDVMIANNIAKQFDVDLEIKAISWDGLIPALNNGTIDAVIAGMSPTEERLEQINFTDSYFEQDIELQVVVASDSEYVSAKTLDDFSGAKISSQQGTFYSDLVSQMQGAKKATQYPTFNDLMQATTSGVIDGYIAESSVVADAISESDELVGISLDPSFELTPDQTTVAIGVAKENTDLTEDLNLALSNISEETRQNYMEHAIKANESETEEAPSFLESSFNLLKENKSIYLHGLIITLVLAIFGTFFGFIIGCILAAMRIVKVHYKDSVFTKVIKFVVNAIAVVYIDVIRGTPMMVQAMIFFYGIWTGLFESINVSPNVAGVIIISFNTAAYVAEILRGAIESIEPGQYEAARSLGLSNTQTLIKVIIPQAVKNTLPALSNELIVNIKDSSVLSVIGVTELFYSTRQAASQGFLFDEAYFIAAIIYLIMTFTFARLLAIIVKRSLGSKTKINLSSDSIQEVH